MDELCNNVFDTLYAYDKYISLSSIYQFVSFSFLSFES